MIWHGCSVLGQGVDDRHGGVFGQAGHVRMEEDAGDDNVDVAAQNARGIDDALTFAELDLGSRQVHGVAAELEHRHFERHAGAQGWFLEDERGCLSGSRVCNQRVRLQV